jgi:hypothetical protein
LHASAGISSSIAGIHRDMFFEEAVSQVVIPLKVALPGHLNSAEVSSNRWASHR